jgi:hypothetical protein
MIDTKTKSTTKTIDITGMKDKACVQKVIAVLKRVSGVKIDSVQLGSATISCGYPAALAASCASLAQAGYKSHEAGSIQPAAASQANVNEGGGGAIGDSH